MYVENYLYGLQQCLKWYSWSTMITLYALYSERGPGCNALNYFAIACSYLTLRPPFVTGDECSQSGWRSICMGTRSVSNDTVGLNGQYFMSCIPKEAVVAMLTIILLLHVHIWQGGHHLSLVINEVKVTEAVYVWVPAVYQMVEPVYVVNFLSGLQKDADASMPSFILLLLVCICCRGHNLTLVINWVKVTEETYYVWYP
jgi:hypothetical protein